MPLNFCGHDVIHGRTLSQHASCSILEVSLNAHVLELEILRIRIFGFCFSLVSKNPYDLGSQIRFRILPKKRTLN